MKKIPRIHGPVPALFTLTEYAQIEALVGIGYTVDVEFRVANYKNRKSEYVKVERDERKKYQDAGLLLPDYTVYPAHPNGYRIVATVDVNQGYDCFRLSFPLSRLKDRWEFLDEEEFYEQLEARGVFKTDYFRFFEFTPDEDGRYAKLYNNFSNFIEIDDWVGEDLTNELTAAREQINSGERVDFGLANAINNAASLGPHLIEFLEEHPDLYETLALYSQRPEYREHCSIFDLGDVLDDIFLRYVMFKGGFKK